MTASAASTRVESEWDGSFGAGIGDVSVRAFDTGTGSVVLSLDRLAASTEYAAALRAGACPAQGSRIVDLGKLTSSGSGQISASVKLDVAQVAAIRAAASGAERVSIAVGAGPEERCASLVPSHAVTPQVWFEPLPYIRTQTAASVMGTAAPDGAIAVSGSLRAVDGDPVAGASIVLTAARRGDLDQILEFAGTVPAGAAHALITIGSNAEGVGPGPADLTFYEIGYSQGGDGVNLVPNARFEQRLLDWGETSGDGRLTVVTSDRGSGSMMRMVVAADQWLYAASGSFSVTPGAAFRTWAAVRMPEASIDNAYLAPLFLTDDWKEMGLDVHPLGPVPIPLGTPVTDTAGAYSLTLDAFEPGVYGLLAEYAGNPTYLPTRARTDLTVP